MHNSLSFKRSDTTSKRGLTHSLRYPVLTLPFEVTSEIFTCCLPGDLEDFEPIFNFNRDRLPTALLLSQICRLWRYVALGTPKIWARFRVSVGYRDSAERPLDPCHLAEWIGRAESSPLSFVLDKNRAFHSPDTLEPIILQIISFSSRWPEVDLRLRNDGLVAEPFRSGLRNRLPLLQTLRLKSNSNVPRVVDAFEHAPNLHTVILDGIQPTSILLPWGQLTHFTGETLREQDCSHVLRSAVSLVECKFLEADGEVDPELLPPHRNLEVLHLAGHMLCAHILCILTLPALLELKFDDGNDNECHEEFSQFLSRSQPPLHRLSLYRGYQLLVHGFPLLPHLAVLEIDLSIAEMSDLLRKFRDFDAAVFLPNLRSVVVSIQEPNSYGWNLTKTAPIDYGDLADALEHRWNRNNAGPRLTSLRMSQFFADNYDEEAVADKLRLIPPSDFRMHLPRLLELVKECMQIAVTVTVVSLPPAMWI